MKKRQWLLKMVAEQVEWMRQCGGTLTGYVTNYTGFGRTHDEAITIYNADLDQLKSFESRLGWR